MIVALLITVIAVMGLAYTFGIGRGMIDGYAASRDATGIAQSRIEFLRMESMKNLASPDLDPSAGHPVTNVTLNGSVPGTETWTVDWIHDPKGTSPGGQDYKRITVTVAWVQDAVPTHVDLQCILLAK